MKKRWIIPLSVVLIVTALLLISSIFRLYTEAEKVQSSIFTNEVLMAGEDIVNRIDALIKGDTIPSTIDTTRMHPDTSAVIYKKTAKKFILDSTETPVGLIKTTISYSKNNIVLTVHDTLLFDTTYRKMFPYMPYWAMEIPGEVDKITKGKKKTKLNANLIEMDSNTVALLNVDYLNRIISEALANQTIITSFDFALYNAFTTKFVIEPRNTSVEKMLNSEYVFSLKTNEHIPTPHYFILYFPQERAYFLKRMGFMMELIAAFLIIILIISGFTLYYLYKQKKIADIKNDFINNITHEFKTPISTISLACDGLSDPELNDNVDLKESYISIIKEENNRLKVMVSNILQLAQLNKGQLKMKMEYFDLHETIQKVAGAVSLQVSAANGTVSIALNAEKSTIMGDIGHIDNVIINIIENAIKYAKGSPTIEITTHNERKYIVLSIKDYGVGIAKKDYKRIFQEFYRVSTGNIHNTKGHGLGLGYVKKIIALHSGQIVVKSIMGKETNFIVFLPTK
ncbi:MAG: HAMP domain-containing histidine kinase [Bacteroidales bacterium]|jgi:signal transduction histidine kinase|nr:HAMP domain-containing histidine kinase [Bacteroidales bacterium]